MTMTIGALLVLMCCVAFLSGVLTTSVPDTTIGDQIIALWQANTTDPPFFTLWWGVQNISVDRRGQVSGQQSIGVFTVAGLYTVYARTGDSDSPILDQTSFSVTDDIGPSSTFDSFTTVKSSPASQISNPTDTQGISQTHSDNISAPTSTRSAGVSEISSSFGTSSTSVGGPDNESTNLPTTARKNISGRLVGGILGGCICLGLISLCIFRQLRLRRRPELNLIAIPYDAASPDLPIRMPDFFASKPRLTSPGEINTNEPSVAEKPAVEHNDIAEIVPTERQRNLQAPVAEIDQQLVNSEAMPDNVPNASPELTRALIMENTRLQRENQTFRGLHRSDWAFGLADVPPPSYPHSPTSTQ
ncbi:hypothetical protein C8J56DRAFT_909232 [Mycena floridula]|nr:hypothetical protein C8J56DRAFT_909232 [Mycena floridula]